MPDRAEAPGQISADDILDSGTGMRAVLPASSDMFVPLQIAQAPTSPGLSETPEGSVSIKYMSPTGTRMTHVPWREGLTVETACKSARTLDPIFRLLRSPVAYYTRKVNGLRVRLNYKMNLGDVLHLTPTQQS